ncbi:cyclophilin-type peptidyl-prolyl cis-trans isomerase [Haematococcus lacustris]
MKRARKLCPCCRLADVLCILVAMGCLVGLCVQRLLKAPTISVRPSLPIWNHVAPSPQLLQALPVSDTEVQELQELLAQLEADEQAQSAVQRVEVEEAWVAPACHMEAHAEYFAEKVVKWGAAHVMPTAGACCDACLGEPDCNIWVWCASRQGCGQGRGFGECWLKYRPLQELASLTGYPNPRVAWVSGSVYSERAMRQVQQQEVARLQALKSNSANPLVFLDVAIQGQPCGRITISLFAEAAPRAAENFRQLCTGEAGIVPEGRQGAGRPYHFKGNVFYRIVDRFIIQGGGSTDSVFGGKFKDDPGALQLKHDRKGLLCMSNSEKDSGTSQFSILMAPAPHLDGRYPVFGEIVEGFEVALKINALALGKPNNAVGHEAAAVIVNSGQLAGPIRIPGVP